MSFPRTGIPVAVYASSIIRMVVTALSAVVGNGEPSSTAAANARSCHANVVSPASSYRRRSAALSSDTTAPFLVTTSRPSCAWMKFRSHRCPSEPITCRSARNSPSRVNAESNQPVIPFEKASRAAMARSTSPSGSGSASAPVTVGTGSPAGLPPGSAAASAATSAPAAEATSRRQSIA